MADNSTVFVFGAGATRGSSFVYPSENPCLPPLDRDFFTQLQRVRSDKHQKLIKRVMQDVVELFGNNFDVTMETVFTTLEHTIRMVETTGDNRDFNRRDLIEKRERLVDAIHLLFEESLCQRRGSKTKRKSCECAHHEKFVKDHLSPGDSIISLNYDCVLDFALKLHGAGKWNAKYGYALPLAKGRRALLTGDDYWSALNPPGKDETVHLYKLHGSLHFVFDTSQENAPSKLKQRPYTRQNGKPQFTIIPPEWNKEYGKGNFAKIWKGAAEALRRANRIVFIGYSLPASDLHTNALFRTALKKRCLDSLVVVNPDRDTRKRIRSVLQRSMKPATRVISFDFLEEYVDSSREILSW